MASSLLFRIQSIFDNTGFREASASFASTLGWIGKLSGGMAKLAFSAKGIGAIGAAFLAWDVAKAGVGILKFLYNAAPAAATAEVSFTRLNTQLKLMGKGSADNIKLIQTYAEQTAQKSQFAGVEVQSAVTAALRRTGDLRTALKEVSVAQDLAAATGMSLEEATNTLNRAQAGYTRILSQITDLRQTDIQQAVRQGTLLDLVSKKFSGSASDAANTYAGKLAILSNLHKKLGEDIGNVGLPLRKFVADLEIFGLTTLINAGKGLTALKGGLLGLPLAFILAKKEADAFKRAMAPGKEFTFNFDKELELENARLGKTRDERQQIARDWARIDDILVVAEGDGVDALTKEQIALVQSTQWGSRQLEQLLSDRVSKTKEMAKKQFEARRQYDNRDKKTPMENFKEGISIVKAAEQANVPAKQLADYLNKSYGISKGLAEMLATVGESYFKIFDNVDNSLERIKLHMAEISGKSNVDKAKSLYGDLSAAVDSVIKTQVQPKFNVKIDFAVPVEAIQEAVKNVIVTGLPSLIASIFRTTNVTTSKETKAAAPLS